MSEYSEEDSEEMSDEDLSSEGMDSDEAEVFANQSVYIFFGCAGLKYFFLRSGGRRKRTREAVKNCWRRVGARPSRRRRNRGIEIGHQTTLTMTARERKAATQQLDPETARLVPSRRFPAQGLREVIRAVVRSAARRVRGASPDPAVALSSVSPPYCMYVCKKGTCLNFN